MNRRKFIQTFFLAGVVLSIPFKWAYGQIRHRLRGDGVTDDTEAMQALLDGEPVEMPDGTIQQAQDVIHIPIGTYRITDTLEVEDDDA